MIKKAWDEGECPEHKKPVLVQIEGLNIANYEPNIDDCIGYRSDTETVTSNPAFCNDEALLLNDNLMANSSLIMLSQNNRV
jgi:hypothetical protein